MRRATCWARPAPITEMEKSGKKTFCCGAGGGRMWMEETRGTRINAERTRQVLETGAATVATSCPFCMVMLSRRAGRGRRRRAVCHAGRQRGAGGTDRGRPGGAAATRGADGGRRRVRQSAARFETPPGESRDRRPRLVIDGTPRPEARRGESGASGAGQDHDRADEQRRARASATTTSDHAPVGEALRDDRVGLRRDAVTVDHQRERAEVEELGREQRGQAEAHDPEPGRGRITWLARRRIAHSRSATGRVRQ